MKYPLGVTPDARQNAPAAERNRDAILGVLRDVLPALGTVLEVGSGTGQHVAHFARALPELTWQPSEPRLEMHASILAWARHERASNVLPPLALDVHDRPWPVSRVDAMTCINVVHVAPWETCLALLAGAARTLAPGGALFLYGPYRLDGQHVAQSNADFDRSLREQDARWGVRDVADVAAAALERGLDLAERIPTPRNNTSLVFRRSG